MCNRHMVQHVKDKGEDSLPLSAPGGIQVPFQKTSDY